MAVPDQVHRVYEEWDSNGRNDQPAVAWQRDLWIARIPGLAPLFHALPDKLSRKDVRKMVLEQPATPKGMFDALAATYAWGWSTTRIGVRRARPVLCAGPTTVGATLLKVRAVVLDEGPLAGYWALKKKHRVRGLGPSFGTKFLYFCSAESNRALILDEVVSTWLRRNTDLAIPWSRYAKKAYASYLEHMTDWAGELAVPPDRLEECIFSDEARRRHLPGWGDLSP